MHVIPEVRHDSWNERVDSERQLRYYGILAQRYRRQYTCWRFVVLFVSIAVGIAGAIVFQLIAEPAPWIGIVLADILVVMGSSIVLLDLSNKTAQADSARHYYSQMARIWKQFWWRQHDADAVSQTRLLQYLSPPDIHLPIDHVLHEECHNQANKIVKAEYAAASATREGDAA